MTERATRTSSSIAIALCTAAASLVASPARALQPLETFLSAARERNPDVLVAVVIQWWKRRVPPAIPAPA
jgi:hypothetical protein